MKNNIGVIFFDCMGKLLVLDLSKNYKFIVFNKLNIRKNEFQRLIKKYKESYYNPDLLWSRVFLQIFSHKFKL